jgi:hypothetical protein
MTISPGVASRLAPHGPGRAARHLRLPGRTPSDAGATDGRRDLVIAASTVVGMAVVLNGPLVWLAAILLLAATVVGTLQVLGDVEGPDAERGIPIETLFLPAVAAIGCLGAIRLVPLGLPIVPALLLTAVLIDRTIVVEARTAGAIQGPTADDRSRTLVALLVVALVAFVGVAAIVPGGIAGREPAGAPLVPLPLGDLVLLALADALVAALLGYRAAALRGSNVRDTLWAALTYGVAIAVGAAAIRAMGIPRLVGPALLMFLFYLWDTLHATAPSRRRDPRWMWETIALTGLAAAVAFWNLRLVG